jgi:branched-subunit amino acid transport protein AzlD
VVAGQEAADAMMDNGYAMGLMAALAAVVALQWRLKNALLSMLIGATVYVLLRNAHF